MFNKGSYLYLYLDFFLMSFQKYEHNIGKWRNRYQYSLCQKGITILALDAQVAATEGNTMLDLDINGSIFQRVGG